MKIFRLTFVAASALFALSTSSFANTCYVVYDRNEQTVYRDIRPPVDLSKPIGAQVNARWRGAALVIVGDAEKCIPLESADSRAIVTAARPAAAEEAPKAAPSDAAASEAKGRKKGAKAGA
jgi:hypothetical protein